MYYFQYYILYAIYYISRTGIEQWSLRVTGHNIHYIKHYTIELRGHRSQ